MPPPLPVCATPYVPNTRGIVVPPHLILGPSRCLAAATRVVRINAETAVVTNGSIAKQKPNGKGDEEDTEKGDVAGSSSDVVDAKVGEDDQSSAVDPDPSAPAPTTAATTKTTRNVKRKRIRWRGRVAGAKVTEEIQPPPAVNARRRPLKRRVSLFLISVRRIRTAERIGKRNLPSSG